MKVADWKLFPDEFRAALITGYPTITWRVALARRDGVQGVTVGARRGGREVSLWVAAEAIERLTLHELLETTHTEAERQFAAAGSP